MDLVEALAAFNRKERYWLIRNALGPGSEALDVGFRARLGECLGIPIPADAWWAMDYHLDWLVGALHLVDRGMNDGAEQHNETGLVKGNQEDMDLIVAFGETLILIEAKGDTSWGKSQILSKLTRLEAVLKRQARLGGFIPVIRLVLVSPKESKGLRKLDGRWPDWMLNPCRKPYWMDLEMALEGTRLVAGRNDFRRVTRWNTERRRADKNGMDWKVI